MKAKDYSDRLELDLTPSGLEEEAAYSEPDIYDPRRWLDPEVRRKLLANEDYESDIKEKRRFAKFAYKVAWVWVWFLIGVIILQATPD